MHVFSSDLHVGEEVIWTVESTSAVLELFAVPVMLEKRLFEELKQRQRYGANYGGSQIRLGSRNISQIIIDVVLQMNSSSQGI